MTVGESNEELIISFLAFFNQIDKHFDKILDEDGFAPYNDKLKKIAEGRYSISNFVRKHLYQLKNMGELRNFITHGIKTNGETYAAPTQAALDKIRQYAEVITNPPTVIQHFKKMVFVAKTSDMIREIIPVMRNKGYTHIPIYDDQGQFIGILSEAELLHWLADMMLNEGYVDFSLLKVEHAPLASLSEFAFVSKHTSVYEIDRLFTDKKLSGERFLAVFITETGECSDPLLGIISSSDANVIDQYLLL